MRSRQGAYLLRSRGECKGLFELFFKELPHCLKTRRKRLKQPTWRSQAVQKTAQDVRSGTSRQKQVPGLSSSRWMLPPCAFSSSATIAKPKPTPPFFEPL
ncbi:hypothetical protein LP7551_00952 [Roseibium album]|nr:hypothetical protein LP7551_00952 [Roseibium album]